MVQATNSLLKFLPYVKAANGSGQVCNLVAVLQHDLGVGFPYSKGL